MTDTAIVQTILSQLKAHVTIPIGISNRHIHLSQEDFDQLFPNQELTIFKELKQPGFYAANQKVTIIGPKGELHNVRLLGPLRPQTQVELSQTDARSIGVKAPIRLSGDLSGAAEITISTKDVSIVRSAAIVAKRHIHMNPTDAALLGFQSGDVTAVKIMSKDRTTIYEDVEIRPAQGSVLEMHLDTDEANASGCGADTVAYFI